jgi:hypothetical protein
MSNPTFTAGKWLVPKDPDDIRLYKFDFAKDLANSETTAVSATAIVAGVTVVLPPVIEGTVVTIKLAGLDLAAGAANFCVIRITCANGEQIDGTMWFVREDH